LLAYVKWKPPAGEALFAMPDATGLAAHRDPDSAIHNGVCEVVERDAAMLSWKVPGWPVQRLAPSPIGEAMRRALERLALSVRFFDIGRLDGPSVILAIVSERDGTRTTCGTACRPTETEAAEHAVEEALMLRHALFVASESSSNVERRDRRTLPTTS